MRPPLLEKPRAYGFSAASDPSHRFQRTGGLGEPARLRVGISVARAAASNLSLHNLLKIADGLAIAPGRLVRKLSAPRQ